MKQELAGKTHSPVWFTWNVSIDAIQKQASEQGSRPWALALLRFCALLAPDHIPLSVFETWLKNRAPEESSELLLDELIASLTGYSLVKIDADEKLPYTVFADSDTVKVGEWVLAVGNPYNLNSTVTAGIVSAKARNLDTRGIQSFIQTDAAVNPGNSGGALVNTRGELIGINTMISSQTGSYVGYSFAVPSNITKKIIEDLMEYGNVQRGILGVEGAELNGAASKELGIKQTQGFYVSKVNKNSGAEKSGIKSGDVIIKLDNQSIGTYAELSGYINTKRPNDKIQVTIIRDGNTKVIPVTLTKNEFISTEFKGLELENIDASDKKKFNINYGVRIKDLSNERLEQYADELKGGVILKIGNVKINDIETLSKIISEVNENQSVQMELLTANGQIIRLIL
jgi:S1-C subfamily serine protease